MRMTLPVAIFLAIAASTPLSAELRHVELKTLGMD